ncbi:ABC transporter ATP-binding protein [Deinococcus sp. YIM 134068]|uniref:ABC transporter ATP-binding protein n=1 Tax=Deinococcus lichenicola TaxID=3118910 RepID=UPI002F9515FE
MSVPGMMGLEVLDLGKTYPGGPPVLEGVSLSVAAGERLALLGVSGSGKSTLLRCVAGFETPDGGDIRVAGRSVLGVPAERRGVGLVFQAPLLFPHLTVRENVAFGPRVAGLPDAEVRRRVDEMLVRTDLMAQARARPHQLSGGQAQRAALARTLAARPRLLLLDEPLSALDAPLRRRLREWLVTLLDGQDVPSILVTHDGEEAFAFGQRLGVLHGGRLAQVGTPAEVYARPASAAVAALLGAENLLPGVQRGREVQTVLGTLPAATERHGPVTVVLRAEQLVPGGQFTGQVTRVVFAGTGQRVTVRTGDGLHSTALWPLEEALTPGQTLGLGVRPGEVWTVPPES